LILKAAQNGAMTYADIWGDDIQSVKAAIRDDLRAKIVAQRRQELAAQTNSTSAGAMPTYESVPNEPQISQALRTQQTNETTHPRSGPNIRKAFREADSRNLRDNLFALNLSQYAAEQEAQQQFMSSMLLPEKEPDEAWMPTYAAALHLLEQPKEGKAAPLWATPEDLIWRQDEEASALPWAKPWGRQPDFGDMLLPQFRSGEQGPWDELLELWGGAGKSLPGGANAGTMDMADPELFNDWIEALWGPEAEEDKGTDLPEDLSLPGLESLAPDTSHTAIVGKETAGALTEDTGDDYIYDPINWENEFENSIEARIDQLSPNLSEQSRVRLIDNIILEEAEKLQQKYRTVYETSGTLLAAIFSPGLHKTLAPLFIEFPTEDTEINPYFEAAAIGFSTGFSSGLWYEAFKGITSGGAGGYADDVTEGAGNSRVLWSGGKNAMDVAADFATKNGLKTLEKTATGKLLTTCQNIANRIFGEEKAYQLLSPLWDKASARFVRGADGVIHAFLNSQGISDTSVFMRIEYEIAKERGLKMVFHLVK
jgi:hypothetical protein